MNETVIKIIGSRPDLSEYVFHFTKGNGGKNDLKEIISCEELQDVNKTGVICFTEAPLLLLDKMFSIFDPYPDPLYARFGVAFIKTSYSKKALVMSYTVH